MAIKSGHQRNQPLNISLQKYELYATEPYEHQEEAILELFAGNNVILNTPTGSGKSLVAENVGMITGDATSYGPRNSFRLFVHGPRDPTGKSAPDHSRGAAWQIPLLSLLRASS